MDGRRTTYEDFSANRQLKNAPKTKEAGVKNIYPVFHGNHLL